jgi:hypothetical protein
MGRGCKAEEDPMAGLAAFDASTVQQVRDGPAKTCLVYETAH